MRRTFAVFFLRTIAGFAAAYAVMVLFAFLQKGAALSADDDFVPLTEAYFATCFAFAGAIALFKFLSDKRKGS